MINSPFASGSPVLRLPPRPAAADPILALYQRYVELKRTQDPIYERSNMLSDRLRARYGDAVTQIGAPDLLGHDPDYAEAVRLCDECDRLTGEITDTTEAIMDTAAVTPAGLCAKMKVANDIWVATSLKWADDYHDDVARTVISEAVRVLERVV